jgi:hypothetical protein
MPGSDASFRHVVRNGTVTLGELVGHIGTEIPRYLFWRGRLAAWGSVQ